MFINLELLQHQVLLIWIKSEKASAGVMISASHNPALDNGIKFFGGDGYKLDDDRELEIEALLDATEDTLPRPSAEGLGTLVGLSRRTTQVSTISSFNWFRVRRNACCSRHS